MKLTTPVNGLKNGELYSIRDSYAKMLNESAAKSEKDGLFAKIYESVKASDYEKLTAFAKKNRKLCDFATASAIKKACKGIECNEDVLNEVCAKVKCAIDADLDIFKKNCKEISADAKDAEEVRKCVNEADDYDDNEDDEKDEEPVYRDSDDEKSDGNLEMDNLTKDDIKQINDLTKDVPYDRSDDEEDDGDDEVKAADAKDDDDDAEGEDKDDAKADDIQMGDGKDNRTFKKAEDEFDTDSDRETAYDDDDEGDVTFKKVGKGYCVKRIVAGVFVNRKLIGSSAMLYSDPGVHDGDFTNAVVSMEDVLDLVNSKVGIYFADSDYEIDFSVADKVTKIGEIEVRESPKLLAGKVMTSDLIDGNEALASMFGPKGRYADYLYNVDGTPKFKPNDGEVDAMTDAEKDVSVVSNYPVLYVSASVCKVSKTSSTPKDLTKEDVKGTGIVVKG